jgi:hypothetical protein
MMIRKLFFLMAAALVAASAICASAHAASARLLRDVHLLTDRYVDAPYAMDLKQGTVVDTIKSEAGWVQVRHGEQVGWLRASWLSGNGAEVAAVASVEGGRNSAGNILATSGIRSLARASRHALIIGIGEYSSDRITALSGVQHDMESARKMAAAMSIPDSNIRVLRDREATAARIEQEIAELNARVQPGDRVFIYYSGHGSRWYKADANGGACVEALMAADAVPVTNLKVAQMLKPISEKTDKLMVFYDACHSGGIVGQPQMTRAITQGGNTLTPKFAAGVSQEQCSTPTNIRTRGLATEAQDMGSLPQNIVHISSSRQDEVSFDDANSGGVATQAWRDCMLGEARDADGSGGISVEEIAACAQTRLDKRFSANAQFAASHITIGGNRGFIPARFSEAVSMPPAASAASASTPQTAMPGAALQDIFAQRDPRRQVKLETKTPALQIGRDQLDLNVTSSHAGYLHLVLLGSDKESYYLLFPNDLDRDNRVEAGQTLRLPRPNWAITAQGPAGTDRLLAVVTESPRDLSLLGKDKTGPFLHTLTDGAGRANLQWLMGSSANTAAPECMEGGTRRNIVVVGRCSDSYGAALLDIVEK